MIDLDTLEGWEWRKGGMGAAGGVFDNPKKTSFGITYVCLALVYGPAWLCVMRVCVY